MDTLNENRERRKEKKKNKTLSRTHTDYRNVYVRISASVKQQQIKERNNFGKKKNTQFNNTWT